MNRIGLFATALLFSASAWAQDERCVSAPDVPPPPARCRASVDGISAMLQRYWPLAPEARYDFFSQGYRDRLKADGIKTARDYARRMNRLEPGRTFVLRTPPRIEITSPFTARAEVTVEWIQGEDAGLKTYFMDLIRDDAGNWRVQ